MIECSEVEVGCTFSEAVAILLPDELKARAANGLSWAGILETACCNERGNNVRNTFYDREN